MNILYVASRYHTNQVPIIKGWLEAGDRAAFICQYRMQSEDYSVMEPVVLGYSRLFEAFLYLYKKLFHKRIENAQIPMYLNAQFGLPPMRRVKRVIREFRPDVVIYRERCVYNAVIYQYCRRHGIKGILYNQTPYWEESTEKKDIFHRAIRFLCPSVRMTPVIGSREGRVHKSNTFYVPFVIEPHWKRADEKKFFQDGRIHIVCVGKYEKRKGHIELLECVSKLKNAQEIELVFIGESSRELYKEYVRTLRRRVRERGMEKQVRILENLTLQEVYREYRDADLFVLPSTGEVASVSQLEAMSCALPVICSDTNGTADCVRNGRNGYLFHDRDFDDLREKLERILSDKERMKEMGRQSLRIIREEYTFKRYKQAVLQMMEEAR